MLIESESRKFYDMVRQLRNLEISIYKIADQLKISRMSVHRILNLRSSLELHSNSSLMRKANFRSGLQS